MDSESPTLTLGPTAERRPARSGLALTPGEDLLGFVGSYLGRALLFLITGTSVLAVLLILFFVVARSIPFFRDFGIGEFLTSQSWRPTADEPTFGALTLIVGSLYVSIAALLFAVPVGILAAVFLSDIVSWKIRDIVKPVVEILAAIPSVAYGFFAVLVLAPWMQSQFGFSTGTNALNASVILAVMALPTIISVAEDAISALGRELREASYSLGATRLETMVKVVIPAAHSGIIAAVVLGMMRAIGETMVVWMASGNATQIPHPWWDLSQSIRTMTATIAGEMGEAPEGMPHRSALFAVGVVLLLMTFVLNIVSEYFLSRARKATGKS
ncbi:MAG: phosphate ABC transporter permease subunit PstC [Sedimentisphaerales bacterium]|nr:phosphate ABC transporter permease subunit PstC [Sedimentisphaerales bacterium]HNY77081.1 phosphate ABC transporter permease subunit PstC [Sedimentisphaerales bacterium]HOC62503.1 phosphate ABC transporter permease subunit PstC [Sedimentisphaerales bacterium]HOH63021.1 phosphate ABC transporter permease subunit PstC [Sedimentisphaerales bacterium]HPY48600.1 phosphate ABC transporter permease subunit PstC [Sedimentisphaerales bacterium]